LKRKVIWSVGSSMGSVGRATGFSVSASVSPISSAAPADPTAAADGIDNVIRNTPPANESVVGNSMRGKRNGLIDRIAADQRGIGETKWRDAVIRQLYNVRDEFR
jgi:hypothetical protein